MRNRTILAVLLFFLCGAAAFAQGILVEAESFREKGGWAVDQQFMDKMGSPIPYPTPVPNFSVFTC